MIGWHSPVARKRARWAGGGQEGILVIAFQQLWGLLIAGVEFISKLVVAIVVFVVSLILARLAGSAVVRVARTVDSETRKLPGRLTTIAIIIVRAFGLGYEEDVARAQDVFLNATKVFKTSWTAWLLPYIV